MHSWLSGTSTDVEMRSRMVMRDSISLRIDSIEPCERKKPIGQRLVLAHQAEQQMLGLDVRAAVLAGLVAREKDHSSGFFRIAFKHGSALFSLGYR